jgi:hypothetical protein
MPFARRMPSILNLSYCACILRPLVHFWIAVRSSKQARRTVATEGPVSFGSSLLCFDLMCRCLFLHLQTRGFFLGSGGKWKQVDNTRLLRRGIHRSYLDDLTTFMTRGRWRSDRI